MFTRKMADQMITHLKQGWCRGTYAQNIYERAVQPYSDDAEYFCILGAATKANCMEDFAARWRELFRSDRENIQSGAVAFNDRKARDVEDVIRRINALVED